MFPDVTVPTPPPPVSTAEYYDQDFSTMDYLCCAKDRTSAGVQTKVELLVELLPSSSSNKSSSNLVLAPSENSSPAPIPPPILADSQCLQYVLNLSMSKQHAVRSGGCNDEDYNHHGYIHHDLFWGLDWYAPSTGDTIHNWRSSVRHRVVLLRFHQVIE